LVGGVLVRRGGNYGNYGQNGNCWEEGVLRVNQFEDLEVWQKARDLAVDVYRVTRSGEFGKDWGLRDQIRRAAVSVMSNIAEGFDRYSRPEFRQFLSVAHGSAGEVRSQLHLARALGYLSDAEFMRLHDTCLRINRMIAAMRSSLSRK
jgi:four helix bundle protein